MPPRRPACHGRRGCDDDCGRADNRLFGGGRLEYALTMIPFEELIAALDRYKRRKELEAAAGNAAPTPGPKVPSGKVKATISADDYSEEL